MIRKPCHEPYLGAQSIALREPLSKARTEKCPALRFMASICDFEIVETLKWRRLRLSLFGLIQFVFETLQAAIDVIQFPIQVGIRIAVLNIDEGRDRHAPIEQDGRN